MQPTPTLRAARHGEEPSGATTAALVPRAPLELPGWVEFNEWRTGLAVRRFTSGTTGGIEARAVMYLDRRGRIRLPPNNPYMPVVFHSARRRPSGRTEEWHRAVAPLVDEMKRRGLANRIVLPPDVEDVRPWRWRGFLVDVGYTYCLDLPLDPAFVDRGQRQGCDRAVRSGMVVDRLTDASIVMDCLRDTQERKGFTLGLCPGDLQAAQDLLGTDNLRMYACFDPAGVACSAVVVIHAPGARAVGWLAGTRSQALPSGSGHLVWHHVFEDLAVVGAPGIDLCGANIVSTGTFKARWGARLVPSYDVRTYSLRAAARLLADWRSSRREPAHG